MLTEETVQQILTEQAPSILAGLKEEISSAAIRQSQYIIEEEIGQHVRDWIKAEVLPELTKQLVESKDGLVSIGTKAAPLMCEQLANSLCEGLKKNLETSYSRKRLFEAFLA